MVEELTGAEAARYVMHLRLVAQYADAWEAEYVCDQTGHRWLEDYPRSEQHGGGPPRLRRIALDEAIPGSESPIGPP